MLIICFKKYLKCYISASGSTKGEQVTNVPHTPGVHCLAHCSSASLLSSILIVCSWLKVSLKAKCVQYEHEAQTPLCTLKWSGTSQLHDNDFEQMTDERLVVLSKPSCMSAYSNVLYCMAGFAIVSYMSILYTSHNKLATTPFN